MPITHVLKKEVGCTFEVWDQTVTLGDWIDNTASLIGNPDWPTGSRHLTDLRTSEDISTIYESDLDEISALFSIYAERVSGLRLAIVVGDRTKRKPELFARFLASIGVAAFVCEDIETACGWLGIDVSKSETTLNEIRTQARRPKTQP